MFLNRLHKISYHLISCNNFLSYDTLKIINIFLFLKIGKQHSELIRAPRDVLTIKGSTLRNRRRSR